MCTSGGSLKFCVREAQAVAKLKLLAALPETNIAHLGLHWVPEIISQGYRESREFMKGLPIL
jgi:hypothetical protein